MKNDKLKSQYRINEQIRVREVRIVGDEGSSVVPTRDALNMAREQGVDLVEISPNANPPVCRLIDYSKFLYQQKKRQKEMKAPKNSWRKEIRYVRMYSSVGVRFCSKSRVRCCSSVSPMIWRKWAR